MNWTQLNHYNIPDLYNQSIHKWYELWIKSKWNMNDHCLTYGE